VEALLVAMDAVSVDRTVIDGPDQYTVEAARRFPDRIAWVAHFNPLASDIADTVAAAQAMDPPPLATRIVLRSDEEYAQLAAGAYEPLFLAAAQAGLPIFMFLLRGLGKAFELPQRHPDVLFVIDHFGMPQPPLRELDDPPF